jgi:hypothetical protein
MTVRIERWMLTTLFAAASLLALAAPAVADPPPDATLYDLTQNMRVVGGRVQHRVAEGALAGVVRLGTPFCPDRLASQLPAGATECAVTATGADDINLTTGLGSLTATITVVTTGDNPFAAPQLVLDRVSVSGRIDFSPALSGAPYGTVEGRVDGRGRFTGVFRQPFLGSVPVPGGFTLRQIFCPLNPTPNPNLGGVDYAWVETDGGAPTGRCIDVQAHELSLGYPPPALRPLVRVAEGGARVSSFPRAALAGPTSAVRARLRTLG